MTYGEPAPLWTPSSLLACHPPSCPFNQSFSAGDSSGNTPSKSIWAGAEDHSRLTGLYRGLVSPNSPKTLDFAGSGPPRLLHILDFTGTLSEQPLDSATRRRDPGRDWWLRWLQDDAGGAIKGHVGLRIDCQCQLKRFPDM